MVVDELLADQLHHMQHVLGKEEGDLGEHHRTLVAGNVLLLGPLLAMEVSMALGGQQLRRGTKSTHRSGLEAAPHSEATRDRLTTTCSPPLTTVWQVLAAATVSGS